MTLLIVESMAMEEKESPKSTEIAKPLVTAHTLSTALNLSQIWPRVGGATEAWFIHAAGRDDAGAVKDGLK